MSMLIAWVVGVQVLAAAGDVGSVDGPQAFVETRTVVDVSRIDDFGPLHFLPIGYSSLLLRPGVRGAQQARVSASWGFRLGAHRLLLGASWTPSVFLFEPSLYRAQSVTPGLLEPTLAAVFVTSAGVIRPRLSLPVMLSEPWYTAARFDVQVRRAVSEGLLVGLEAGAFVSFVQPWFGWAAGHRRAPLMSCPFPERRCVNSTLTRWSGELAARGEWHFRDDWSLAGRLSVAQRSELVPVLFSNPNGFAYWPEWIRTEASFDTVVTWSPTRFFGMSASFAVSEAVRSDGFFDKSATVGLSVWLRTDARLQRNWIDL